MAGPSAARLGALAMPIRKVKIPPRRSLKLYAAFALLLVFASYLFTVALAIASVYLPLLGLSKFPNINTLLLFIAGIVVAATMLWSLLPRFRRFNPPGPQLEAAAHPQLFAEIAEVANLLDEPMPRHVYLIGDANAWVADRGGLLGIGSYRIMGLGLPLLATLDVSELRAILTHEFAHYYGGDTALGPWVHRARMTMARALTNIASLGKHIWPNLMAFVFSVVISVLNWYWRIFLRGINLVSRRQEYRADELACILNGRQAFGAGLRSVFTAGRYWPAYWKYNVAPLLGQGCLPPIAAGFSEFMVSPEVMQSVHHTLEKEIREGRGSDFDSHPPLRDRLKALEIQAALKQPELNKPAITLLNDVQAHESRLLQVLNPTLSISSLRPVSWEEQASTAVALWRAAVAEYSHLLAHASAANLHDAMARVPEVAPYIRDPEGMLLMPKQREYRARDLLAKAFALALAENGWTVHARPGNFYLCRGEERLNPFQVVHAIGAGQLAKQTWLERCQALGIDALPLDAGPRGNATSAEAGGGI
jgi:heat shock protein HtpX